MSSSQEESPSAAPLAELPYAIPVSTDEILQAEAEHHELTRRRLLKMGLHIAPAVAIGSVASVKLIGAVDKWYTERRWPPGETEFTEVAHGPEDLKGEETWVMPGFGMPNALIPAREIAKNTNNLQRIVSIGLPNQGYTARDLAFAAFKRIKAEELHTINIVGDSLGSETFFEMLYEMKMIENELRVVGYLKPDETIIPRIHSWFPISSPSDINDVYFLDNVLSRTIAEGFIASGIEPGFVMKLGYSAIDGPGDLERSLNITQLSRFYTQVAQSIAQADDDYSPRVGRCAIATAVRFSWMRDHTKWESLIPKDMKGFYITAKRDDTVRGFQAADKYSFGFHANGLTHPIQKIEMDTYEHAAPKPAGKVIGKLLLGQSV